MTSIKPNYRILVLYNPQNANTTSLEAGVTLAKRTRGAIDLLSISSLKKFSSQSNQVALIRAFNEENAKLKSRLSKLVDTLSEEEGIPVIYTAKIGLVKEVIEEHIRLTQPEIVILGSHKGLKTKWANPRVFKAVMNCHQGIIMFSSTSNCLHSNKPLTLGFIERIMKNQPLINQLSKSAKQPHKLFQFSFDSQCKRMDQQEDLVVYDFEDKAKMFSNFLRYIEQSKINILCVHKALFSFKTFQSSNKNQIIKKLTNLETPILVFPN